MLIVVKIIYFQALWYISAYLGSKSLHLIALSLCCLSLTLDYLIFRYQNIKGRHYLGFILGLGLFGFLFDLAFDRTTLLNWDENVFYPASLLGIWMIFAAYYPSIFSKFDDQPKLSFFLGAIFGPLAYWAGSAMGAIQYFPQQTTLLISHTISWGLFFFVSLRFFKYIKQEVPRGNH